MKVTYEKLIDFQTYAQLRLNKETSEKKQTKLGSILKKMIGDAGSRIKGTLTDIGIDYNEKCEDIRREFCSTDKDDNILRGELTRKDALGNVIIEKTGPYLFTRDNDKKCATKLKNLLQETVHVDPILCNDLPKDLTEAEEIHFLGFVFTQETLNAWKTKNAKETNQNEAE